MEATDLGAYQRWLGAGEKNWEILREGRFGQGFSDGFSPESGPGMCWEDVFFFTGLPCKKWRMVNKVAI